MFLIYKNLVENIIINIDIFETNSNGKEILNVVIPCNDNPLFFVISYDNPLFLV
jgi:hypothetical protein